MAIGEGGAGVAPCGEGAASVAALAAGLDESVVDQPRHGMVPLGAQLPRVVGDLLLQIAPLLLGHAHLVRVGVRVRVWVRVKG